MSCMGMHDRHTRIIQEQRKCCFHAIVHAETCIVTMSRNGCNDADINQY